MEDNRETVSPGASSTYEQNLVELVRLHFARRKAWRLAGRRKDDNYMAALSEFKDSYDRLAFPGGLEAGLIHLRSGQPDAIEYAIQFLEVNPTFFRSGYTQQKILQRLKNVPLSDAQRDRLARLIVDSMDGGNRRAARWYARLAGALHSKVIESAAQSRLTSQDPEVARRAKKVLEVIASRGQTMP